MVSADIALSPAPAERQQSSALDPRQHFAYSHGGTWQESVRAYPGQREFQPHLKGEEPPMRDVL